MTNTLLNRSNIFPTKNPQNPRNLDNSFWDGGQMRKKLFFIGFSRAKIIVVALLGNLHFIKKNYRMKVKMILLQHI
jgi:hypothetical protein